LPIEAAPDIASPRSRLCNARRWLFVRSIVRSVAAAVPRADRRLASVVAPIVHSGGEGVRTGGAIGHRTGRRSRLGCLLADESRCSFDVR
jgi:hypothetical protein